MEPLIRGDVWYSRRQKGAVAGNRDYGNEVYGIGVEVGSKDIGLGGITTNTGIRLHLEANTTDFESIRPTIGIVAHFWRYLMYLWIEPHLSGCGFFIKKDKQ